MFECEEVMYAKLLMWWPITLIGISVHQVFTPVVEKHIDG